MLLLAVAWDDSSDISFNIFVLVRLVLVVKKATVSLALNESHSVVLTKHLTKKKKKKWVISLPLLELLLSFHSYFWYYWHQFRRWTEDFNLLKLPILQLSKTPTAVSMIAMNPWAGDGRAQRQCQKQNSGWEAWAALWKSVMSTLFSTEISWTHPSLSWSLDASIGHIIWPKDFAHQKPGSSSCWKELGASFPPLHPETKAGRVGAMFLNTTSAKQTSAFPAKRAHLEGITPLHHLQLLFLQQSHLHGNGWFPPWEINRSHSQW